MFFSRLMLACLLLPSLRAAAQAQAVSFPESNSVIPGGRQDITHFDLVKMVVPG
ncbi:hypothetical protein [Mesorhizobium sp. B2-4-6]|uniref:hypothetical protein n=1 Tax=Mesorhizobium sp. B2-4-6 TaxID=2589943 RepID=UPI0015E319A2|nr:hypothetical protein [Mesorhizobium sp. B2-4-6]